MTPEQELEVLRTENAELRAVLKAIVFETRGMTGLTAGGRAGQLAARALKR